MLRTGGVKNELEHLEAGKTAGDVLAGMQHNHGHVADLPLVRGIVEDSKVIQQADRA